MWYLLPFLLKLFNFMYMLVDYSFLSFGHTGIFLSLFTLSDTCKSVVLDWEWSGILPLTPQGTPGDVGRHLWRSPGEGAPGTTWRGRNAANIPGCTAWPDTKDPPSQCRRCPGWEIWWASCMISVLCGMVKQQIEMRGYVLNAEKSK